MAAAAVTAAVMTLSACPNSPRSSPDISGGHVERGSDPDSVAPSPAPVAAQDVLAPINPPPAEATARDPVTPEEVVREAQRRGAAGEGERLAALVTSASRPLASAASPEQLRRYLGAAPPSGPVEVHGPRAVVHLDARPEAPVVVLLREAGAWRVDFRLTSSWRAADPGPPDAENRPLSLAEATAGLEGAGDLLAILTTTAGELRCRLFEARAPATVAHFVGLARGLRAFVDPLSGAWTKRPLYDGLPFHSVQPGVLAQTGDPAGDGRGGPGFEVADELDEGLRFDRAGVLALANRGPNSNGSQFFVTARPLPALDGLHSIFGVCDPVETVARLTASAAPPVTLERVTFERAP